MKKEQALTHLMKRQAIHLEVAQLIKELRQAKELSQTDLCARVTISRQYLSEIENGHRRQLNLAKIEELIMGCGEQLVITTSYSNPLQVSDQTVREDQVLRAYAEGQTEKAEVLLGAIRSWRYPTEHIVAKCKRNMAIAISYHFREQPKLALGKMNQLIMGLSALDCGEEAEYFTELFYRIIKMGEKERANSQVSIKK